MPSKIFVFEELPTEETRGPVSQPLYATHSTLTSVRGSVWPEVVREAEKRYGPMREQYIAASREVEAILRERSLTQADPVWDVSMEKELADRGVIPFGMRVSVAEVLREKGFDVFSEAEELFYSTPLRFGRPAT